jgi:hypothetical protein
MDEMDLITYDEQMAIAEDPSKVSTAASAEAPKPKPVVNRPVLQASTSSAIALNLTLTDLRHKNQLVRLQLHVDSFSSIFGHSLVNLLARSPIKFNYIQSYIHLISSFIRAVDITL